MRPLIQKNKTQAFLIFLISSSFTHFLIFGFFPFLSILVCRLPLRESDLLTSTWHFTVFSGLISAIFTLSAILDLVKVHDNATDKVRAMALRHFCVSDDVPVI